MELQRLDPDHLDPRDVAGGVAVVEAARRVDSPHRGPMTAANWAADLRAGWDGEPPVAYLHRDPAGRVDGVLQVSVSERDNRHLAFLELTVRPEVRRQGLGRALYAAGVEIAKSLSRTTAAIECWDKPHNLAFADALGLERAFTAANRRQVMDRVDWSRVSSLVKDAAEHSADYELVRLPWPATDDLVDPLVELTAAINDAPTDDLDIEDEVFPPQRLRDYERALAERGWRALPAGRPPPRDRRAGRADGRRGRRPSAVSSATSSTPASCARTAVTGSACFSRARCCTGWPRTEPQLLEVDTWNAESNDHMIAVNEALGYQVMGTVTGFQQHL